VPVFYSTFLQKAKLAKLLAMSNSKGTAATATAPAIVSIASLANQLETACSNSAVSLYVIITVSMLDRFRRLSRSATF